MTQVITTEEHIQQWITNAVTKALEAHTTANQPKEWLTLKEAAKYAGVSYNTFMKYRLLGLKICEIEGVKRVSKSEINRFFENNSF